MRQHTGERARRKGANGERFVGFILGRLPGGWAVLHDVSVGRGANIDHVVIGPAGVFTLDAKDLTGKVWIGPRSVLHNGRRTDFLPMAVHGASLASGHLSAALGRPIQVRGALAILADDWTIKARPAAVFVGSPRSVRDWLVGLPITLRPREIVEIAAAAGEPSTWMAGAEL